MRWAAPAWLAGAMGSWALAACSGSRFSASPTDAGASDAGVEANVEAGAEAGPAWCTQQDATFCSDFDENDTLPYPWTRLYVRTSSAPDASAGLDPNVSTSAPDSFQLVLHPYGAYQGTALEKDFPTPPAPTEAFVDFDVLIDQWDPNAYGELAWLALVDRTTNVSYALAFNAAMGQFSVSEYWQGLPDGGLDASRPADYALGLSVHGGHWMHVSLHALLVAADGVPKLTVAVDGTVLVQAQPIHPQALPGTPSVDIGMPYLEATSTDWKLHFDSVTVTLK